MSEIKLPDITLTQLVAALGWIIAQIVSMGWVDADAGRRWFQIGSSILAAAWLVGDSIIRNGRSQIAAAEIAKGTAKVSEKRTLVG